MSIFSNIFRFPVYISKSLACILCLLLFAFSLCGCGGGSSTPMPINYTGDGTSGLRGVVTGYVNSTATTTPSVGNATVSAYLNSPHTLGVGAASVPGPLVAQTHTDAQGNYSLPLIPGFYIIGLTSTSSTGSSGGGGGEVTVTIRQFAPLNLVVYYSTP